MRRVEIARLELAFFARPARDISGYKLGVNAARTAAKVCGDGFGEQGPGFRGSSTSIRTIVIVFEGLPFQIALGETVSSKNLERVSYQKLNRQPTQFDVSK